MALESFYGGKQGVSSIIKASFKFISTSDQAYIDTVSKGLMTESEAKAVTMDECFKRIDYTDVWYGDLCIIDTGNRNNPNNGKLYRRVLKQSDNKIAGTYNTRYAEYIGQISGPSGGMPYFDLGSLDTQRQKAVGAIATLEEDNAPLNNAGWEYAYTDKTTGLTTHTIPTATSTEEAWEQIKVLDSSDGASIQMVPGKEGSTYHDTIRYTWCNVRRNIEGQESDAWVYLGFEIPYVTYDVSSVEESSAYSGAVFVDTSDTNHPFYKKYEFHIPRGTRGIGPEEIFVVNPQDSNARTLPAGARLYTSDSISYNQNTDIYSVDTSKIQTVTSNDSYWVGKWCIYNPKVGFTNTINTDVFYIYLGSYKDVRGVTLSNDGLLTFAYSDGTSAVMSNKIKWINSIRLNADLTSSTYGRMLVTYNTTTNNVADSDIFDLPLIKNIQYINGGDINAYYAGILNPQKIGNINSIKQFWVDPRGHLLGLYDSTEYRPDDNSAQDSSNELYLEKVSDVNGRYSTVQNWIKGTSTSLVAGTDSIHWWHDLGLVKEVTGVKIAMLYAGNAATSDAIINDLNNTYPNGQIIINGADKSGSFIIGNVNKGNGIEEFGAFFYDYQSHSWIYLGNWNGDSNIYFTDANDNTLPGLNDRNATIYFIDNSSSASYKNSSEVIGFFPWEDYSGE